MRSLFLLLWLVWLASGKDAWTTVKKQDLVLVASAEGLSESLQGESEDAVVYFFAPWCVNCRQFDVIWSTIAEARSKGSDRAPMAKFNCEESREHERLCTEAGVDRYPSVIYFTNEVFGRKGGHDEHAVHYRGDLYAEAIRDWIAMMESLSWWRRVVHNMRSFSRMLLPWGGRPKKKAKRVQSAFTEPSVEAPGKTVDAMFLSPQTDAFFAMDAVLPEYQLALQTCVADLALEYCASVSEQEEPYCGIVEQCYTSGFVAEECRPAQGCPFSQDGCHTVNLCVQPDILSQYQDLLISEGLIGA